MAWESSRLVPNWFWCTAPALLDSNVLFFSCNNLDPGRKFADEILHSIELLRCVSSSERIRTIELCS